MCRTHLFVSHGTLENTRYDYRYLDGETRLEPAARLVDVPAPARPPHHRSPARHDAEPLCLSWWNSIDAEETEWRLTFEKEIYKQEICGAANSAQKPTADRSQRSAMNATPSVVVQKSPQLRVIYLRAAQSASPFFPQLAVNANNRSRMILRLVTWSRMSWPVPAHPRRHLIHTEPGLAHIHRAEHPARTSHWL